CQQYYTLCTF
nr:immunoglobulin light chain junction region [Macaca mulatta]MOV83574.1 immunoglobulin light chain junction region [Macaca mulatta]MOV83709.1 immunoglobulin light chain junction region [Macaca mulatta]